MSGSTCQGRYCNNNCVFCYDDHRTRYQDFDQALQSMKALRETQDVVNMQSYLASEATIHPRFLDLITEARKLGFKKIGTITNGRMLADPAFCEEAFQRGLHEVRISLHGPDASTHDALTRTQGSYAQTVRGLVNVIRQSKRLGYRRNVFLSFVVTRLNHRNMADFLRWAMGIPHDIETNFVQIIPSPVFEDLSDKILLSFTESRESYQEAIETYKQSRRGDLRATWELPFCQLPDHADVIFPSGNCEAVGFAKPTQVEACRSCAYGSLCPGVFQRYLEVFGEKELQPVEKRLGSVKCRSDIGDTDYI